jgi:hypothetical protein
MLVSIHIRQVAIGANSRIRIASYCPTDAWLALFPKQIYGLLRL